MIPAPERIQRLAGALTVDVEEYFHVENLREAAPRSSWDRLPTRVEGAVLALLDLLEEHAVRATFFVLGWVAERHRSLVARIAERGHEVASHGYAHEALGRLGPERFRVDLQVARAAIEDAAQRRVLGYRAPTWSVTRETDWAFDILVEEGYAYDSSVFPIRHDRYGDPSAPIAPHRRVRAGGSIVELPPLVLRLGGANLPAAGGGYLRLLPLFHARLAVRQAVRQGRPAVLYVHPWEMDPGQPRLEVGLLRGLRHYAGIAGVARKLGRLLSEHRYRPAIDLVRDFEREERRAAAKAAAKATPADWAGVAPVAALAEARP